MSTKNLKCKSSSLEVKRKRKLLPLRRYNVDLINSRPNDLDPLETPEVPDGHMEQPEAKKVKTKLLKGESSNQPLSRTATKDGAKPTQLRSLVCTFMHREEVDYTNKAVSKLGSFEIEKCVTLRTTHIVCGQEKRTLNVLKGIAYGCWVLNNNWVKESLKAGTWLDEEPYELKSFPAVQKCRIARETLGGKICDIFNTGESYYVAAKTSPASADIVALLQSCGGKVVTSASTASIVISSKAFELPSAIANVSEQWVLDSLTKNELQDVSRYLCTKQKTFCKL